MLEIWGGCLYVSEDVSEIEMRILTLLLGRLGLDWFRRTGSMGGEETHVCKSTAGWPNRTACVPVARVLSMRLANSS
jgi:hypothetical protein